MAQMTHTITAAMDRPADIYDRIAAAWPHLENLSRKARGGHIQARNALSDCVLMGATKPPLTALDLLAVSRWKPAPHR